MKILLQRVSYKKNEVIGVLKYGTSVFFTLENIKKLLPVGIYKIQKYSAPRNGNCFIIYNSDIRKERGFLIHVGNSFKDTEGCILLGNSCNLTTRKLSDSKKAIEQMYREINSPLELEII